MKVFVHLENNFVSYRLQNDGKFVRFTGDCESDYDLMSEEEDERLKFPISMKLDGVTFKIDPGNVSGDELDKVLFKTYRVKIEKGDPVHVPDYDQLKACISSGSDLINNQLALTVFGDFILESRFLNSPDYYKSICFEISIAGNGYIGKEAAEDESYMKSQYGLSLAGFRDFFRTQMTCNLIDYDKSPENIEEDKQAIARILDGLD